MSSYEPGDPVGRGTAGHLPECGWWEDMNGREKAAWRKRGCICEQLRALSERISGEADAAFNAGYRDGYDTGHAMAVLRVRELAAQLPRWERRDTTHYAGCWTAHPECFATRLLGALGWEEA